MANCKFEVIGNILKNCQASRGGVKTIYIASYQDLVKSGNIKLVGKQYEFDTAYTPLVTEWCKFDLAKQTASMTSTYNIEDNGVKYVTTVLSTTLVGIDQAHSDILDDLINSDDAIVIVETNAGKHIFLGGEQAATASASTMETGTAFGDINGYTLEISDETNGYPMELKKEDFDKVAALDFQ